AASGINNAASRIAGLLAVAAFGVVMVTIFNRSLHDRLGAEGIAPAAMAAIEAQRNKLAAIEIPANMESRDRAAAKRAVEQAFVTGFRWIMLVSALLALAGAASAWFLIGNAGRSAGESASVR
ncbi:MAG: MFS transporter, partial [Pseudomonadota bacterium]|nr:MFS transporter [Pseudomonadota bacterium]